MVGNDLARIMEHTNWTNYKIFLACYALSEEQLDAEPYSTTVRTIHQSVQHLVSAHHGYLALLTLPFGLKPRTLVAWFVLGDILSQSSGGLLALALGDSSEFLQTRLHTRDGYLVKP